MQSFFQEGPSLRNQFEADLLLQRYMEWRLPTEIRMQIEPGLRAFGGRVVNELMPLADRVEANPPTHLPYDAWGRRIDEIQVDDAWSLLHRAAAEEGIVAIGYERLAGEYSRIHQMIKLYMYHPSSAFYSCPLAMTDGAARAIELYGDESLKNGAFKNLTTRNPQRFWTSGQWMTERTGGSDVSETSTVAQAQGNGGFLLSGDKWFTSATTSQMALTLARIEGDAAGSKGLSLFYIELRDSNGKLNGIEINRLKDKLGTKALPTAELKLRQTVARLVGDQGGGVRKIATMLNITRLYNSVCAMGAMARSLYLAKDYSKKRRAFGRLLVELPLHIQTLADLQVEFEGSFHLTFHLSWLLGKDEVGTATPEEKAVLRLMIPVLKLWTGKQAVAHTSECAEAIGGAAYIEDTGIPRQIRDAQVFSLWEGTTNVLSLDMLRALLKEDSFGGLERDIEKRLEGLKQHPQEVELLRKGVQQMKSFISQIKKEGIEFAEAGARSLSYTLARIYIGSLLLEFAEWNLDSKNRKSGIEVALRWCALARGRGDFGLLLNTEAKYRAMSENILTDS